MLWGSRSWKDLYKVREYSPETTDNAYKYKISLLVIDTLRGWFRNEIVLNHYCDYQAQKEHSVENIIGSLLGQVSWEALVIRNDIRKAFNEPKNRNGQGLQLPDIVQLFVKAISSVGLVYICIDAVDVLLPKDRLEFLRALQQIIQEAPNARLFLTMRPHIRPELDKHLTKEAYVIDIVADQGDIARYVSREIASANYQYPQLMTKDLEDDIMKIVPERASGT